jgi:hypothetical protein
MATLLSDNFDRANSTTVIGAPAIGPTPTVLSGVGGISTNELYAPTPTLVAVYDLGTVSVEMQAEVTGTASGRAAGFVFGGASATDFYYVHFGNAIVETYRQGPGGLAVMYRRGLTIPSTMVTLKASHNTGVLRAYVDGTLVLQAPTDGDLTSTRAGVRINHNAIRVNNLLGVDAPTITDTEPPAALAPEVAQVGDGGEAISVYRGRDTKALDLAGVS